MARFRRVIDSSDDSGPGEASDGDSSSERGSDLLDMEAHDAPVADDSSEVEVDGAFQLFIRLPLELRQKIWEHFCPQLSSRGRVLNLRFAFREIGPELDPSDEEDDASTGEPQAELRVYDDIQLQDHTEQLRRVLAVHGESRRFALKSYPDIIELHAGSGDAIIRFNKNRDVILADCRSDLPRFTSSMLEPISHIKHIAFQWDYRYAWEATNMLDHGFLHAMPNLETLFICKIYDWVPKGRLRWCASPLVRHDHIETYQKETGLGEDLQWMICWPDFERHADFAKTHIDRKFFERLDESYLDLVKDRGIKLGPMASFAWEDGLAKFSALVREHDDGVAADKNSDEEWSDLGEDDVDLRLLDDYESDGIDDSEEPEVEEANSEDALLDDGGDSEEDIEDRDVIRREKRRRRVVDSDEDDEQDTDNEGEGRPTKRARTNGVVVVSSDEGDSSDTEGRGDSSSVDDADDEPRPRLSLVERLAQERRDNPIPGEEEEDDEEDYSDGCSYGRGEDEDDDDEEEEDEDEEDGMLDRFAEESNGEGEDGYDDEEGW